MASPISKQTATLLITCPDQKGLVATVSEFLFRYDANILHSDQHEDPVQGLFLMRVEWDLKEFTLPLADFAAAFQPLATRFSMQWKVAESSRRPRMAILVSKYDHCLADLLYRHRAGELACEIPLIVSNHPDHRQWAEFHGVPFHVIPTDPTNKQAAETKVRELLRANQIDLVILARYMQILSADFSVEYRNRIINIHHSFLPAFLGGKPYHRAHERGVKLIGATSHYVTEVLDDGPIIEQDVIRISHRDQVADLIQKGRDLEKLVLSRAVKWHLEHRVLVYGNRTVIFD